MWKAPPPPSEPLEDIAEPGWSATKALTEKKLFGDDGEGSGGTFDVDSNSGSPEPAAAGGDNDR